MPADPTPKPAHWTDRQEWAYQAMLEDEKSVPGRKQTGKPAIPPPPSAVHSPDGKWLWDGERWVPAPHKGLTTRALLGIIGAILLVASLVGLWASEANRQDEMRDELNQLNCQYLETC